MDLASIQRLQTEILTQAQQQIRLTVKNALLCGTSKHITDKTVRNIILRTIAKITDPEFKKIVYTSLIRFYNRQRQITSSLTPNNISLLLALSVLSGRYRTEHKSMNAPALKMTVAEAKQTVMRMLPAEQADEVITLGSAANKYHRDYFRKDVAPVLRRMLDEVALDPGPQIAAGQRSSLVRKAELEVRYDYHNNQITDFKAKGTKLVIVSEHADCSERCRPWQGRVYSLDGTSGVADDGRKYVPLETATNIRTKNGKWYNGLFGFGCRHYMVEYKPGYKFPKVSADTERKQYEITQKQRAYERKIRSWRERRDMYRGVCPEEYEKARRKIKAWEAEYRAFTVKNQRVYHTSRTIPLKANTGRG